MSFGNAEVLAFESRRAKEMGELIRINGGQAFVAPALIEVPIERNDEAFAFAERLFAGDFEMMIFLTGVGARYIDRVLATRHPEGRFRDALRNLTVVVRGPKPMAVMREMDVRVALNAPEPNTWREVLSVVKDRPETMVAVQEYGRTSHELLDGLAAQNRVVTPVPVYQWDLPADTAPLSDAIRRLHTGLVDVALFTTSVQVDHLLRFAERTDQRASVLDALKNTFIASIGPTTTETLVEYGVQPNFEPEHPKMGILVRDAAVAFAKVRSMQQ